ncbi:hypothetical protein GCK32_003330 [Trichostrongylus colubriformis]|uniref:Aminopeptidase N n=1 Tax=Trichostrongylus colubriformis TaxID=6319 RepID=A0AAN8F1F8_TRICO
MKAQWTKRTVLRFTPVSLLFALTVTALAVALAIGLTYYFTRKAYDTSHGEVDHHGGHDNSPSAEELLLPRNMKPLLYDLSIKTYLPNYVEFPPEKNLTFDGQVEISLLVMEPTRSIVLNAKNITVIPEKCTASSGTTAASNGIEKNKEGETSGDWIISKFETTPRMSSYLLAVVVSEFEYIHNSTTSGVLFRIWSRPEAKNMTQYALDAGIRCLEYYEKFFDIKFPLRKQDMFALPDFSAGAMENWGLITYRENSLLYDERYYGPLNKQRVALVVAHELAHQWFGNLVTLKWWDDLWLNEGFATFVEYIGTDEISHGNFRMKDYFLLDAIREGLNNDADASSHPLSFRIDKAAEVAEAFDAITYSKGASVLVMLQALIGETNFKQAVTQYLRKFSYSNAQASDLWEVFDVVVKDVKGPNGNPLKVTEFAYQWTTQMGFPLTNKEAQEREKYRHPKYGFKWDVPLWYQEGDNKEIKQTWLPREEPLYLHISDPNASLVVNADRHGFYRQNYDANGWRKIIQTLKNNHKVYSARTRNAIISDAFAAALVDGLEYETVFELLQYAENEEVSPAFKSFY